MFKAASVQPPILNTLNNLHTLNIETLNIFLFYRDKE